jgi:hypothetical protein
MKVHAFGMSGFRKQRSYFYVGYFLNVENSETGRLLPYYLLLSIWVWPKQNNLTSAMVIQNLSPRISYLHFTLFARYSVRIKHSVSYIKIFSLLKEIY